MKTLMRIETTSKNGMLCIYEVKSCFCGNCHVETIIRGERSLAYAATGGFDACSELAYDLAKDVMGKDVA